jgi:hypothetical protein
MAAKQERPTAAVEAGPLTKWAVKNGRRKKTTAL